MKLTKNKHRAHIVKKLKKDKIFWGLICFIFILQLLTYPSIHHIVSDETLYLEVGKGICDGNFTYFVGEAEKPVHTPIFPTLLCLTSSIHNFNLERAEIVNYSFFILMIIVWYFSLPESLKVDKKKFVLLLFANNLLWIYSMRVLTDIPVAFFLSLGILHMYLYFEYSKRRNYYLGVVLLSLGILTKENSLIYLPILSAYLILKGIKNSKKILLLATPLIPYLILLLGQYSTGYDVLKPYKLNIQGFDFSFIPYADLPVFIYMIGAFGVGIASFLVVLKNVKKVRIEFRKFVLFFIIMYLVWELFYAFIITASVPRYHLTLIPFFSLIISETGKMDGWMKRVYYLTLVYILITGFLAAYYFHVSTEAIWKVAFKELITHNF